MSRDYRFILLDASKEAISEVGLVCLSDEDALVVATHVAPRNDVEVWDEARFVGLVPSPYPKSPGTAAQPATIQPPEPAAQAHAAVVEAVPEPAAAAGVWDDPSRPFNPFRRGSWRRRPQS